MRPLTPIRRERFPVQVTDGRIVADAGIWRLPKPNANGFPGDWMIHRPGGWRSAVALVRLLVSVVRS